MLFFEALKGIVEIGAILFRGRGVGAAMGDFNLAFVVASAWGCCRSLSPYM